MTEFLPPFVGLPNLNDPFNWGNIYWLPTIWRAPFWMLAAEPQ